MAKRLADYNSSTLAEIKAAKNYMETIINSVKEPIILSLIHISLKGVAYKPIGASALLRRNLLIYGVGGLIAPFVGIKLIAVSYTHLQTLREKPA